MCMYLFNMEYLVKFEHSPPVGKMESDPNVSETPGITEY